VKKFVLAVTAAVVAIGIAVPVALAANAQNGTAPLYHYGPNPPGLVVPALSPDTAASGVVNVHYNKGQDRFMVNLSVHDALPNATYVLDVRYWAFTGTSQDELGTLTTNSKGTGTAHFKVSNVTPTPEFYIDISVKGGGGGAGGYGDTFIAGPFTVN
jgi:hypothetical protein